MTGQSELVKILFLAADPKGMDSPRSLDEEIRRIELALERAKKREQFRMIQKWAVTDDDLRRALLDHEPDIVHFSGHSGGSQGLAFVDTQSRLLIISGDSLARLFGLCADHVRCVILNACFSEVQAKVISRHIEIVVGMSEDIGDDAAIKFSEGFYDALGAGRSPEKAFEFGRSAIDLRNLTERLVPIILRNPEIRRLTRGFAQGDGPKRIVPRGLRSFQTEDSDFFLELVPGPRGNDGLPTSLRFWKTRIEERNPDRTFPVGLIYGPSGCGKSSLLRAGLLPRLSDTIQPVLVEATADDTASRLLKGLRGAFPGLGSNLGLIDTFIALRRETEATGRKALIVIDQFEQWLHAKTEDEKSELALALRLCDGTNIQCIVMIRDDFWLATKRFMNHAGVPISDGENAALVDLFDIRHARKVLGLFADAYGVWENSPVEPTERAQFLDEAVSGLAQDDRVICVRIALFCELFQGKPWDLKTLEKAGGVEGVGVLFMEETFSADNAPAENRYHQKAVRLVLNALLPEPGSKIKGRMRSDQDLKDASGYADRPDDFQALVQILDEKTHLITPTDPDGLGAAAGDSLKKRSVGRFYQLTHDYLVPSIREWLTRKQWETRRGRAELRLAERSEIWAAKPENRQLPSLWEWTNIRLLTKSKDWTEPQQRMMAKSAKVHGLRGLGIAALVGTLIALGTYVRNQFAEANQMTQATELVTEVLTAKTGQVPGIVARLKDYRRWADHALKEALTKAKKGSAEELHARLALVPVDAAQVEPLYDRMVATKEPDIATVIGHSLKAHRESLTEKLWITLEQARPGSEQILAAASALALYDPANPRWAKVSDNVAQALLSVNAILLGDWLEALRPVRSSLTAPLAAIFREKHRRDSDHDFSTSILGSYVSDQPDLAVDLLMDADPKAYSLFFPFTEREAATSLERFQSEIARKLARPWNDTPLDAAWTEPKADLVTRIESAQGMVAERFGFCQTMPVDEFLTTAEGLRKSGYRPTRCRRYQDGETVKVAAVWARDGISWRLAHNLTTDAVLQTDEQNRMAGFHPVDIAGYEVTGPDGKRTDRYAAVWVERARPPDDTRLFLASSGLEFTNRAAQLANDGLAPLTMHSWRQADDKLSFSSVWHKTDNAVSGAGSFAGGIIEANLPGLIAQVGSLIDMNVQATLASPSTSKRAITNLQAAEALLKTNPDNLDAHLNRALAQLELGQNKKILDELDLFIAREPRAAYAYQIRAIAHARLGHKDEAKADLERFQKAAPTESAGLYLAVAVAAELGDGVDQAFERLDATLNRESRDPGLYYDAACAYSIASQCIARKDQARSKTLSERALSLLRKAIQNGYTNYDHLLEDADLDPIRDLPAFDEIMKTAHLDRRYSVVWTGDVKFETNSIFGQGPSAHLQQCRELAAQGYRMVSLSVARTSPEAPPISASVWRRPVVSEDSKDQLAERQARAAVALVRMGKAEEVWPLLRHSADPRVRSFIVNWLSPLGADPTTVAAELERIPATAKPAPAQGQPIMDAILFHPEISQRRALILALGKYGTEVLSSGEREPLTTKLFNLYRDDPDSGIHGATSWTLRQWGQREKLKQLDAELMKLVDKGDRRWFVNKQGQTFAVIDGPVEFRMGSPPTEPDRMAANESARRVVIPRRFAIADREVTVEQHRRFLKTSLQFGLDPDLLSRSSPDGAGPIILVSWYEAAAYCNWLSAQEGLPADQWCYAPNAIGAYDTGMTIPADVLNRTGYRLSTEAEWEYACRSGTVTSRYYGLSVDLLAKYAYYLPNGRHRAWPGGSLLPNDLGLFDMLGNVGEWVHDRWVRGFTNVDIILFKESVDESPRILRGRSFTNFDEIVRSADRNKAAPSDRATNNGFRLARTYR